MSVSGDVLATALSSSLHLLLVPYQHGTRERDGKKVKERDAREKARVHIHKHTEIYI